ncbi:methylated-DNA-[protein]-cysteine S-methyltransferase [Cognatiyoonia koreensis]|uniref:Methylated-DNA-[protein]-cysteine S-methyltransferase n=1 Tax=Cognatiyoonia koreensis TaxID=364200 RepID=A0A1I0MKH4_9RHOB|nr:methylated-DNA--[protein]-cysteine S-methyltransferase [Cognatiyoonia koreensis]SEV88902.1 methylated-DNA-[protein]-cysteine S-methyltransferase [Cognatiyoonia koreensis]
MNVLIDSPVGPLGFDATDEAVTALHWGRAGNLSNGDLAAQLRTELGAYFAGMRRGFTVSVAPRGSDFQQAFYTALCAIPYGETRTYGDLASALNVSAQAIGQACGANPLAILIPCHRVLSAEGLGGYSGAGGIETKVALLRLEGAAGLLI